MDEENLAVNQSEENTQVESPTTEQIPEEAVAEEFAPNTPEVVREATEETEGEPKKGFQPRIKELVKERNQYRDEARSLSDKLAELTNPVGFQGQMPQYTPQIQPGQEITPEQYQQDVSRQADAVVQLRIKQSEAVNRINNEALDAVRKYPQLDPQSESYDKELSEAVTEAVQDRVKTNPYSALVGKYVDQLMKPYARSVAKEVGKVTENIARQVSETALRPTSIRKAEKTASEKSIAELEQELGFVTN